MRTVAWCACLLAAAAAALGADVAPPRAVAPFDAAAARAHQVAWAEHLRTTVEVTDSAGLRLVLVPPGEFMMGSSDEQAAAALAVAVELKVGVADKQRITAERPQHRVVLTRPFRMSATEVTVGQFRRFLEASGYVTETARTGGGNTHRLPGPDRYDFNPAVSYAAPGYPVTDDAPATQVTWNDAVAFCTWLGGVEKATYHLPTEAQWEYACRAGTTTLYYFGDDISQVGDHAWFTKNSGARSHPVGTKGANAFGLFDMHGSAREWCSDWYDATWYRRSPQDDPTGPPSGAGRVLRGGNWYNKPTYLRSAYRYDFPPDYRSSRFGFRVVRSL